jgi:hypothetical protein
MSHRLQWDEVPESVQRDIARVCGSRVVDAVGQAGGYGPGLAARCELADGRRVFIKAASPTQNPDTPAMIRREIATIAALPEDAPAPALLHVLDDGTWIALVFEEIDGHLPATPWNRDELQLVTRATVALADLELRAPLPPVAEQFGPLFDGWRTLTADPDAISDAWCRAHLAELAALEAGWVDAAAGDRLVHGDVRSDNVMITAARDVVFVDWTSSCVGAPWFDLVCMLPSIELEDGGTPESVLALAGLDDADPAVLLPVVVAIAGYFTERGRLPDPPGLPTLRDFQRAQGRVTSDWLQRLWPHRTAVT